MSFCKKRIIADSLFGVQIVCTLLFGGAQFLRMLTTSQGVSASWFLSWEIFLALNLTLVFNAHKKQKSRVTVQTIASYLLWVVVVTADIVVMICRRTGEWNSRDFATIILAIVGITFTMAVANEKGATIIHPLVKSFIALFCKAIPQFIMAYNIAVMGGGGLAGMTVIAGHITVMTRLGQLFFSIREAGWDKNRTGSAISELGNEISWVAVTATWLIF